MKFKNLLFLLIILIVTSCNSIRVMSDYDINVNFNKYKTFAFYKKGIDRATISDLDKKRIMRAIEKEMISKGIKKSDKPDLLVSIYTKSRERVNLNNNFYYGFYFPWYYGINPIDIYQYTEGILFIDLIDTKNKELVWQGIGSGTLNNVNVKQKIERINEFVKNILSKYPLGNDKK